MIKTEDVFFSSFFASVKIENNIYFSDWFANGLFKINLTTRTLQFINKFVEEKETANLHNHAFVYNNEIWFIPSTNGSKIAIYDLSIDRIRYLDLPQRKHKTKTNKFRLPIQEKHNVWLIPDGYDALLHIDCCTQRIDWFDRWPRDIVWETDVSRGFKGAVKVDDKIYLYPFEGGRLFAADLSDGHIDNINIPKEMDNHCNVLCTRGKMIFFCNNNFSVIWNYSPKQNRFDCMNISGDAIIPHEAYYAANIIGDKLWFMPFKGRDAVCIDIVNCTATRIPLALGGIEIEGENVRYQSTNTYDDRIVFTSDYNNGHRSLPIVFIFSDNSIQYYDLRTESILDVLELFLCTRDTHEKSGSSTCGRRIYTDVMNRIDKV